MALLRQKKHTLLFVGLTVLATFHSTWLFVAIHRQQPNKTMSEPPPPVFELFETFDLTPQLGYNETWEDLLQLRRDTNSSSSLSFYLDKVARKRWYEQQGIPATPTYWTAYKAELHTGASRDLSTTLRKKLESLMNNNTADFVAKPSHLSCSGGVWLTKRRNNVTWINHGKSDWKRQDNHVLDNITNSLQKSLDTIQTKCGPRVRESWALQNVQPGILVEELFVADNGGPFMEFKVFTIWGRVWLAIWRPGKDGVYALIRRDGTTVPTTHSIPSNVDWWRVVELAERLGKHKDMFRTDIFVGRSSVSSNDTLQYVVSETEIHPTPIRGTKGLFAEAAKLWLAGYKYGNYRVVSDSEVPLEFVNTGYLSTRQ